MQRQVIVVGVLMALLLGGCAAGSPDRDAQPAASGAGTGEAAELQVEVVEGVVVVDDARSGERFEVRIGAEDGEVLHAVPRPGERPEDTVLVLTRVRDPDGSPRYELRYLLLSDDGASELLWLPWRYQVHAEAARVLDVPTVPVWSPDGSTVAWVEWARDGTRLRTIVWDDTGLLVAPPDDGGSLPLDDVPPGTQLEAWYDDEDGVPILVGRHADDRFSIRLDLRLTGPVTDI